MTVCASVAANVRSLVLTTVCGIDARADLAGNLLDLSWEVSIMMGAVPCVL